MTNVGLKWQLWLVSSIISLNGKLFGQDHTMSLTIDYSCVSDRATWLCPFNLFGEILKPMSNFHVNRVIHASLLDCRDGCVNGITLYFDQVAIIYYYCELTGRLPVISCVCYCAYRDMTCSREPHATRRWVGFRIQINSGKLMWLLGGCFSQMPKLRGGD